jgi:hypothetical protein
MIGLSLTGGSPMKLPRVRFTVRQVLVAVAALALLMAAGIEAVRQMRIARAYRQMAVYHASWRDFCLAEAEEYRAAVAARPASRDWSRSEAHQRALAQYHDSQASKYRLAARSPWLPVEPDPPEPAPEPE